MCGIVGYVGNRAAQELLLAGLRKLEYRGYDSAGVSVMGPAVIDSVRAVGNLDRLDEAIAQRGDAGGGVATVAVEATVGIGHTRWATHGRVNEQNAHPHFDTQDRVHVVVNGIVENYLALRERLKADGAVFTSETDAEAFSRQQAFDRGASERFVQRRLASGDWIRPVTAVYALARSPGTWKRQCKIAELSVAGSAIAGSAAAALHKLDGFRPGRIELVAPVNSFCIHPFATVHRYSGAKLTVVEGIAVTTIAQTLFDVTRRVKPWTAERAMDVALLEHRVSPAELSERLAFYEGSRDLVYHGSGRWCSNGSTMRGSLLRASSRR